MNTWQNFLFLQVQKMLVLWLICIYLGYNTVYPLSTLVWNLLAVIRTSGNGNRSSGRTLIINRLTGRQDRNICWVTSLNCRMRMWRMSNIYCIWIVYGITVEKAFFKAWRLQISMTCMTFFQRTFVPTRHVHLFSITKFSFPSFFVGNAF